jgi:sulfopyruvate decarboxylase subunit alpha
MTNGGHPLIEYPGPCGSSIIAALKSARVEFVAALPDITVSDGLLWPLSRDADLKLIRLCKEDEGVSVCAGLAVTGKRSVLLMQNTGYLDSINAIRAIGVEFERPICMIVGLLSKEPDRKPAESGRYAVRIMEPLIDVMGIDRIGIETDDDVAALGPAIDRAYATSRPMVALVERMVRP